MCIRDSGYFLGLVSAGVGAFATIQPRRAIQKIGVTKVVSFGMFVGGILTCFMTVSYTHLKGRIHQRFGLPLNQSID